MNDGIVDKVKELERIHLETLHELGALKSTIIRRDAEIEELKKRVK